MAEIAITSLLILMAYGWTLSFSEINWDDNLDIYVPIGATVVAVHLILAGMTYIDMEGYYKYHDYAGI